MTVLVAFISLHASASAARMDKPAFYARYEKYSTDKLMEMGKNFYEKKNMPDSALVCYTIVANRLVDGTLPKSEYRQCVWAMMRLSSIYMRVYNKWDVADEYLQKSLDLALDNNFHEMLPYIYGNRGIVDYTSDVINHRPDGEKRYLDNQRKVYYLSVKEKQWEPIATSFYNLVLLTLQNGQVDKIVKEVENFASLKIPDTVSMYRESQLYLKVARSYLKGNYADCIRLLENYRAGSDAFLKPAVQQMVNSDLLLLYSKTNQNDKALALIQTMEEEARKSKSTVNRYSAFEMISNYWREHGDAAKAEHFDYLKLKEKERLNEDNNMGKIKENRFLNQIAQVNSDLKAESAKKRLITVFLVICSVALVIILVLLIMQVRASREQKRYVDILYRRNQQLLANNQLLLEEHSAPDDTDEPTKQKPVDLPDGIIEAIEGVMNQTDVICQSTFSMSTLCDLTGFNRNYISQAIQKKYNTNFKGLLNSYRIKEACRRMSSHDYDNLTIEAISAQLGYSSRTYFSTVFKKVVGISAAEYIKHNKNNA
jgi:YesN/AraC family two-component response regulator